MGVAWNVSRIIDLAGGVAKLRHSLALAGQRVPETAAMSMWKSRGTLPAGWSAPILYVLLQRNKNVDLQTLFVVEPDVEMGDLTGDPFATTAPRERRA